MSEKCLIEVIQGQKGTNISFNGRLLYSDTSTPEKRVESLPVAPEALYLVVSPLLFRGTEELLKKLPPDAKFLSIESNPQIFSITREYHQKSALNCFDYILTDSYTDKTFLEYIKKLRFRKIIPVKLNLGYMLNRKFYDQLTVDFESVLSSFWKNRMTTIHMGRLWCRNIFLNTPYLKNASWITDISTDKVVINLGAGESLEESINFIKENRDAVFLTAADTAVASLLENNLKPDLVVAVEAQHANLYDFYGNSSLNLPVAADMTSSPELLRKIRGPLYFFISEFNYSNIFDLLKRYSLLPPVLPPLGSVGIISLLISLMITKNWVLFSGLDFSFIPEKYHAGGSPSYIMSRIHENRMNRAGFYNSAFTAARKKVRDKSGRMVYTDQVMRSYIETLNSIITHSARVIDIGKTGIGTSAPHYSEIGAAVFFSKNPETDDSNFLAKIIKIKDSDEHLSSKQKSNDFLLAEKEKLSKTIADVVYFQNNRNTLDRLPSGTLQLLRDVDYTWLFFPDKKSLPSSDSSFLKRFLFSASWFLNHITNALSLINHQS